MAKRLLAQKRLEFNDTDISFETELRQQLTDETGQRTVPYIFIGSHFVGGYDDLQQLEHTQQLDSLVTEHNQ